MKNHFTISAAGICLLFSSLSYGFFCPKNFNEISIGDSMDHVIQLCGAADSKSVKDAPDNSPQEWNYYIKQQGYTGPSNAAMAQGTLKTSIAFDGNGKVVNISVNGIGVASFNGCGSPVSLGDTRESVESNCGKASFIAKQDQSSNANNGNTGKDDETNKLVELTYTGTPSVTLIFEGGKLTGKR